MNNLWFECKVKYQKTLENGAVKQVNEPYLVDALNFTEAERRIIEEAVKTIQRIDNPSLFERNYQFHRMLVEGITIEDKDYAVNPLMGIIHKAWYCKRRI